MRAAHLVRLEGDVDGARLDEAVSAISHQIERSHEPWCAAVHVDLGAVTHLSSALVPHLRRLRCEGHARSVTLSLVTPWRSPAHRVLEFHQRLTDALPRVDVTES